MCNHSFQLYMKYCNNHLIFLVCLLYIFATVTMLLIHDWLDHFVCRVITIIMNVTHWGIKHHHCCNITFYCCSCTCIYAPINVMLHLPPPEWGGDKGWDLTGNSDPTHGAFDFSLYYIPQYTYSSPLLAYQVLFDLRTLWKVVKSPRLSPPPSGGGRWGITLIGALHHCVHKLVKVGMLNLQYWSYVYMVIEVDHQLSHDIVNTCTPPYQKHPHLQPHYAVTWLLSEGQTPAISSC